MSKPFFAPRLRDERRTQALRLERRVGHAVVIEEGDIGLRDLAVFYSADYGLALVRFLNGDITEAERLRVEWLARRSWKTAWAPKRATARLLFLVSTSRGLNTTSDRPRVKTSDTASPAAAAPSPTASGPRVYIR